MVLVINDEGKVEAKSRRTSSCHRCGNVVEANIDNLEDCPTCKFIRRDIEK